MLENNLFAGSKYQLPGIQGSSKTNTPSSKHWWPNNNLVIFHFRSMNKQNSIWSKALIMPLTIWNCVLSYNQQNYFSENELILPRKYFHNRIAS